MITDAGRFLADLAQLSVACGRGSGAAAGSRGAAAAVPMGRARQRAFWQRAAGGGGTAATGGGGGGSECPRYPAHWRPVVWGERNLRHRRSRGIGTLPGFSTERYRRRLSDVGGRAGQVDPHDISIILRGDGISDMTWRESNPDSFFLVGSASDHGYD